MGVKASTACMPFLIIPAFHVIISMIVAEYLFPGFGAYKAPERSV